MSKVIDARAQHDFKASAQELFDVWLNPELVRKWMSLLLNGRKADVRAIETDARIAGKFRFADMRNGEMAESWGYYKVINRPHKIVFTWFSCAEDEQADSSVVTINIVPKANGCSVELIHVMDAKWAEYRKQTESGWNKMLSGMESLLENSEG